MKTINDIFTEFLPIEKVYELYPWSSIDSGRIIYCEIDDNYYFGTQTAWISLKQNFHNLFSLGYSGGIGTTGNIGHRGMIGNTGDTGDFGDTGGSGNSGGTGRIGGTGATGGTGGTGDIGYRGYTGGVGGHGKSAKTGGTGETGRTGGTGTPGDVLSIQGIPEYGNEYAVIEVDFLGIDENTISVEVRNVYNGFVYPKTNILSNQIVNNIYYSSDKSEITIWYDMVLPKVFKVSVSNIIYNDTGKDLKIYSSQFITFKLFHSLDGTFKEFTPMIQPNARISIQVTYLLSCSTGSVHNLSVFMIGDPNAKCISTPYGIDCFSLCTNKFLYKTNVKLTITPSPKYEIKIVFGADIVINNIAYIRIRCEDVSIGIIFKKKQFILKVIIIGIGTVTSSLQFGIDCPTICCEHKIDVDTIVRLKEIPGVSYIFSKWINHDSVDIVTGDAVVLIDRNRTVTAVFEIINVTLTVKVLASGYGTVTSEDTFISTSTIQHQIYKINTSVKLTQVPVINHLFINWTENTTSGSILATTNDLIVIVSSNKTVCANYKQFPILICLCVYQSGSNYINLKVTEAAYTVNSGIKIIYTHEYYPFNTHIILESFDIIPKYKFLNWYDKDSNTVLSINNIYDFNINKDTNIYCLFSIKVTLFVNSYLIIPQTLHHQLFNSKVTLISTPNVNLGVVNTFYSGIKITLHISSNDISKYRFLKWSIPIGSYQQQYAAINNNIHSTITFTLTTDLIINVFFVSPASFVLTSVEYINPLDKCEVYSHLTGVTTTVVNSAKYFRNLQFGEKFTITFINIPSPKPCGPLLIFRGFTNYGYSSSITGFIKCQIGKDRSGPLGFGYTGPIDIIIDTGDVDLFGPLITDATIIGVDIIDIKYETVIMVDKMPGFDYSPGIIPIGPSFPKYASSYFCRSNVIIIFNLNISTLKFKIISSPNYGEPVRFHIYNQFYPDIHLYGGLRIPSKCIPFYTSVWMTDSTIQPIILNTSDFPNKTLYIMIEQKGSMQTLNIRLDSIDPI
jgi:hypothetical protein